MITHRLPLIASLGFVGLLGCTSTTTPSDPEAWLIRPPVTGNIAEAPASAPVLRIASTEVAAHLRGLVVMSRDGRVKTFVGHRFAAPISSMVEDSLRVALWSSGHFRLVLGATSPGRAERILRVNVRQFEIAEAEPGWTAVVTMAMTVENDERQILSSPTVTASVPCEGETPKAFVAALEKALGEALVQAARVVKP